MYEYIYVYIYIYIYIYQILLGFYETSLQLEGGSNSGLMYSIDFQAA